MSVTVVGEIVPYSFADKESGELLGLVHLRVPGDVVSVDVDPSVADRMREGETWRVTGGAIVRKAKGRIHINRPESLKRLSAARAAGGPSVDFGDSKPAQ